MRFNKRMLPHDTASRPLDCLIVGAGPAGLTAAVYLARYRRSLAVVDSGGSRAAMIPESRNLPGHVHGLSGEELLRLLRAQAALHGAVVRSGTVLRLERVSAGFAAWLDGGERLLARTVLLATGIHDRQPEPAVDNWDAAVRLGSIRLCPICDGFEVIDRRLALIASGASRVEHALFLTTYSADVTLFCHDPSSPLTADEQSRLRAAGVAWVEAPVARIAMDSDLRPVLHLERGDTHTFDALYPMLGEVAHAQLALDLGVQCGSDGRLIADARQMTSVAGLYAAGDVVDSLNQISVACGQAAIAATAIHNQLRSEAA